MSKIILRLFGLTPLFLGLYFAVLGVKRHALSIEQSRWMSVTGRVEQSEIINLESKAKTRAKIRAIRLFQPFVSVGYEVLGKFYRFETRGSGLRKREAALEVLSQYPQGAEVVLFYNPQKPEQATLRKSNAIASYLLYVVCIACIVASVLLVRAINSVATPVSSITQL